jgi:phosphopantetheine adenylyltransferase
MTIHRTLSRIVCSVPGCHWIGSLYSSFKSHLSCAHTILIMRHYHGGTQNVCCTVSSCGKVFSSMKACVSHLQTHLNGNDKINCPFNNCSKSYTLSSSFRCHVHRVHRHENIPPNNLSHVNVQVTNIPHQIAEVQEIQTVNDPCAAIDMNDLDKKLLNQVAEFYLMLQTKLFLASSTVDIIVQSVTGIHQQTSAILKDKILNAMHEKNHLSEDVENAITDIFDGDYYQAIHNPVTGILRSEKTRRFYYKESFGFVAPEKHVLGKNAKGVQSCFHYVSIQSSLKQLLADCNASRVFRMCVPLHDDILRDFYDGSFYTEHFDSGDVLQLILYQDDFEIVNPLGSAKTIHKITAIYYSVGNIAPEYRSNTDHMQLVLLCKTSDFKYFGASRILTPLYLELKYLETTKIWLANFLPEMYCKVVAFLGDHLGHHTLAGLSTSFSHGEVCQYCRATLPEIRKLGVNQSFVFEDRTEESMVSGCILNKLESFTTRKQLLPCAAHDFLEGIVAYDLSLCLKALVKKGWFTEANLLSRLSTVTLCSPESNNKPSFTLKTPKINGKAIQLWELLRFLPLYVPIKDSSDYVWLMIIEMIEVGQLLFAPTLSTGQVSLLKSIILDYLTSRVQLFPNIPIRPKHHFLTHYPEFILAFGPPIRFWTLRFEAKHRFFKSVCRVSQNYINITHTLSERHQLFQAYMGRTTRFRMDIEAKRNLAISDFSDAIGKHIRSFHNCFPVTAVKASGIFYKEQMVLIIDRINASMVKVGYIVSVLYGCERNSIHFIVKDGIAQKSDCGYFILTISEAITSISLDQLICYFPLNIYTVDQSKQVIFMKHAILDQF